MNGNTDHQLVQILQPLDEWIIEIRQQWTPFKDHIKSSQDPPQEYQVNTTELSFDSCERLKSQNRVRTELEADWQSWQSCKQLHCLKLAAMKLL